MLILPRKFATLMCFGVFVVFGADEGFSAQTTSFPSQPVRLVVPASMDGGTSLQAQALAAVMRTHLAQQVLVEHRAGAGGVIGSAAVAQAPADGHTLLLTSAALAVNAAWLPEQLPFDVLSGFAPVSLIATAPLVLVVHPGVPAKTIPELVALAKRSRPMIHAGGNAAGSLSHVALSQFAHAAGFRSETLLFNGGGPAMQSLIQGRVDLLFVALPLALPPLETQRLRALAVTAAEPLPKLAGVPAMKQFFPGMVIENWYALLAPAATPQPVITRLHAEVRRALADESVQALYSRLGLIAVGSTPEALALMLRSDVERYAGLIRQGHLRMR
jgi:hypothetical protein